MKMTNKNNGPTKFILGIIEHKTSEEEIDWYLKIINNNVPPEVVIMQLKSLIKNYEKMYFDEFTSKL